MHRDFFKEHIQNLADKGQQSEGNIQYLATTTVDFLSQSETGAESAEALELGRKILSIVDLDSGDPLFYMLQGHLYEKQGELKLAYESFITARDLYDKFAESPQVPADIEAPLRAAEAARRALNIVDSNELIADLADRYEALDLFEAALPLSEELVRRENRSTQRLCALGATLFSCGKIKEAKEVFLEAERDSPVPIGPTASGLLELPGFEPTDELIEALHKRLTVAQPIESAVGYHFALGRAYEKRGDIDRSFDFFLKANAIARTLLTDSEQELQKEIDQANFLKSMASQVTRGDEQPHVQEAPFTPIFIYGMPRTGSSLLAKLLSSYRGPNGEEPVFNANEDLTLVRTNDFFKRYGGLDRVYGSEFVGMALSFYYRSLQKQFSLVDNPNLEFVIDKTGMAFNGLDARYLLFPDAPMIWLERDPMDACWSMFTRNFGNPEIFYFSYDLDQLGRFYTEVYESLRDTFKQIYKDNQIHFVQYEDLVQNPAETMKGVLEHCGLEYNESFLNHHEIRASLPADVNVNQPIHSGSIGKWKKFEKHLGPLLKYFPS